MSKLPPTLQNLPLPIIGSPLFIISNPKLVIAQCIAGVVGSMPALNATSGWPRLRKGWLPTTRRTRSGRRRRLPSTRSCTSRTTGWSTTWRCA